MDTDSASAIVPAEWLDDYEALLDREDARIARERLGDMEAGRTSPIAADEVYRELNL